MNKFVHKFGSVRPCARGMESLIAGFVRFWCAVRAAYCGRAKTLFIRRVYRLLRRHLFAPSPRFGRALQGAAYSGFYL